MSNGRSRFKARMGPGCHIRGKDLVFHPLTSLPSEAPGSEGTRRSQGRSGPSRPRIARFGVESQPFPPKNRHRVRRIAAPVESRIVVSAGTPGTTTLHMTAVGPFRTKCGRSISGQRGFGCLAVATSSDSSPAAALPWPAPPTTPVACRPISFFKIVLEELPEPVLILRRVSPAASHRGNGGGAMGGRFKASGFRSHPIPLHESSDFSSATFSRIADSRDHRSLFNGRA